MELHVNLLKKVFLIVTPIESETEILVFHALIVMKIST